MFEIAEQGERKGTYQKKNNEGNDTSEAAIVDGSSDGECLAVLAACVSRHDEWILDTTCSFHICCNKDWFISYELV